MGKGKGVGKFPVQQSTYLCGQEVSFIVTLRPVVTGNHIQFSDLFQGVTAGHLAH
jgi:hypothetical protein